MLRCRDEVRRRLEMVTPAVRLSNPQSQSDSNEWHWTDIFLDGSIEPNRLIELIDDSYRIARESLDDDEKKCLSALEKNLDPTTTFEELLIAYGLERFREQIRGMARQGFLLKTEVCKDGDLRLGASKIGGLPDLPAGVSWPNYQGGKPLAFLAQINLSDLRVDCELPQSGMLSFFSVFGWQADDGGDPELPNGTYNASWTKVFCWTQHQGTLRSCHPPSDVNGFAPARIQPIPYTCFPADVRDRRIAKLAWKSEVQAQYLEMVSTYNRTMLHQLGNPAHHLMLGYAAFEQTPPLELANGDLCLLFQLASDLNAKMHWGDGGKIYFFVTAADLAQRSFDAVFTDYDCW